MCDCFSNSTGVCTGNRISRRAVIGAIACLSVDSKFSTARSQDQFKHILDGACNFYPDDKFDTNVYSFGSTAEAQSVVSKITSSAGLKPNFEIIAYNVPNAAAVIQNGIRYILYNQAFINQITQQTSSEWGAWSIMAHEVGHHLNGHTLQPGGSKPPTELEADEFAGFAVQKIGGTLDQALSPYKTMNPAGSSTHPPRDARLTAVTKGWNSAAGTGGPANIPTPGSVPAPVANAHDMLTAIVTSLQNGMTPPFPMLPQLKAIYDSQAPMVGQQLKALGSLTGLTQLKPPVVMADATYYDYRSSFSTGQAFWRIGVAPNGVIAGLWISPAPL
ncbi:hypothetical protein [Bosea sp. (in: a-proteobacteria)]|jgi:hypothetical protein|uniref:hypothetical protein n=1 Tax=Bosea sp. (in: a-proteobacteria) TaxID=1871050 RepID=UPI003F72FE13